MIFLFIGLLFRRRKYIRNSSSSINPNYIVQYNNIPGVDSNFLSYDVYIPNDYKQTHPIIVYVHGGAFIHGDKANKMQYKPKYFTQKGCVFISINYRLSPEDNNFSPNRVKYPIHNEDISLAISHIIKNIQKYKGDINNMVLMGHSAGATLITLTGVDSKFLGKYGISNFQFKGYISVDSAGYDICNGLNENDLMYVNAFDYGNCEIKSPMSIASNSNNLPSFFIIIRGSNKRIKEAKKFYQIMVQKSKYSQYFDAAPYSHEEVNDNIGNPNDTIITKEIEKYLQKIKIF